MNNEEGYTFEGKGEDEGKGETPLCKRVGWESTEEALRAQAALHAFRGVSLEGIRCFPPGAITLLCVHYKDLVQAVVALFSAGPTEDVELIQRAYQNLMKVFVQQKGFGGVS